MAKNQGFKDDGTDSYVYQELAAGTSIAIGMDDSDSDKLKIVTSATAGANPSGTAQAEFDPTAVRFSPLVNVDNLRLDGNTLSSTDTNGDVIVAPDGSGVVSVTAAPIVPSTDRADSLGSATNSWDNIYVNGLTFDDGTETLSTFVGKTAWTPVLSFGGGSTGIEYSTQTGWYSRIGDFIIFEMRMSLSSKGIDTGLCGIAGLPGTVLVNHSITVSTGNVTFSSQLGAIIQPTNAIILQNLLSGTSPATLSDVQFSDASDVLCSGSYFV